MMSAKGQTIRLPLKSINITGRATQGVTVMRFKHKDDNVSCMAIINTEKLKEQTTDPKLNLSTVEEKDNVVSLN